MEHLEKQTDERHGAAHTHMLDSKTQSQVTPRATPCTAMGTSQMSKHASIMPAFDFLVAAFWWVSERPAMQC